MNSKHTCWRELYPEARAKSQLVGRNFWPEVKPFEGESEWSLCSHMQSIVREYWVFRKLSVINWIPPHLIIDPLIDLKINWFVNCMIILYSDELTRIVGHTFVCIIYCIILFAFFQSNGLIFNYESKLGSAHLHLSTKQEPDWTLFLQAPLTYSGLGERGDYTCFFILLVEWKFNYAFKFLNLIFSF